VQIDFLLDDRPDIDGPITCLAMAGTFAFMVVANELAEDVLIRVYQ
jgi:hypothetical protein